MVGARLEGQVGHEFVNHILNEIGLFELVILRNGQDTEHAEVRQVIETVPAVLIGQSRRPGTLAKHQYALEGITLCVADLSDQIGVKVPAGSLHPDRKGSLHPPLRIDGTELQLSFFHTFLLVEDLDRDTLGFSRGQIEQPSACLLHARLQTLDKPAGAATCADIDHEILPADIGY